MAKVYVVTSGEYSDYGIEEIFSEVGLAEAYISIHKRHEEYEDEFRIEEYGLDPLAEQLRKGIGTWEVYVHNDSDDFIAASPSDGTTVRKHGTKVIAADSYLTTYCFARNHAHAEKIAQDRFAKFSAEAEGIA